jgi:transcriptional regulator with XRE-family HTH domain
MTDPEQATRPTAEPITAVVADRVRSFRERSGMSQAELAERMAELGTPWKRATVVNLEKRGMMSAKRGTAAGRDSITAQELLTLAQALSVPPVWLLADTESGTPVPIAKGIDVAPWSALMWMTGKKSLTDDPGPAWDFAEVSLADVYEVATLVEHFQDIQRHRDRVALFLSNESANAKEARYREADESDKHLLRRLAECLKRFQQRRLCLPRLPGDVVKRATELGVELPAGWDRTLGS